MGAVGVVQPLGVDREHPGPQPDGRRSGSSRSSATSRSSRDERWRRSSRCGCSPTRVEPGKELKAFVTLKPYKGERETVEVALPIPAEFPLGGHEAIFGDATASLRRAIRNNPGMTEPRDIDGLIRAIQVQTDPKRTAIYLNVPAPDSGVDLHGQALPNLPGSVRSVFASKREAPPPVIHEDLMRVEPTRWVVEGGQTLRFNVVKDAGLSLSLYR